MKNNELFKTLANLTGYSPGYLDRNPDNVPDYMDWCLLMPIAFQNGLKIDFDQYKTGCTYATHREVTDDEWTAVDETPQIAIVKCLIAKLENKK